MAAIAPRAHTAVPVTRQEDSLPTLFSRLGDDVMQLFDTKISLLKVEVKEEVSDFVRSGVMIAVGGVVAAVGFAFLNVALAFGISTLFAGTNLSEPAQYALGFVSAGALYLIIGAILVAVMKNRLSKQHLVPDRTIQELRKDKQWLKNEL